MAELTAAETTTADPCCAPEQQASCCEPSAKADCCDHEEGCGCAAGGGVPSLGVIGVGQASSAEATRSGASSGGQWATSSSATKGASGKRSRIRSAM
jgi:hypothetical protein